MMTEVSRSPSLPPAVQRYDRLTEYMLFFLISNATFLQKFNISWDGGANSLPVNLFLMLATVGIGIVTKRLVLRPQQTICFLIMMGGLTLSQLLGNHAFSIAGISLLLLIHSPYIFGIKEGAARPGIELLFFQKVCVIIAIAGTLQFFMQFVIGWQNAFLLDTLDIGQPFLVLQSPTMNNLNPVSYGGDIYKSNGFFLNEPSFMCQFLAIGTIIEIVYFKNMRRLAIFAMGISVTFSGTGLIILFCLTPFYLLQKRQFLLLLGLCITLITAPVWAPAIGLGSTLDRVGEFKNENSSGYARFISPFRQIDEFVFPNNDTLFFGNGSGTMIRSTKGKVDYTTWDPTWAKLVFEYGVVGTLSYLPFVILVFIRTKRSPYLKGALMITFFLLGGNLASSYTQLLVMAMLAWPSRTNNDINISELEPKAVTS